MGLARGTVLLIATCAIAACVNSSSAPPAPAPGPAPAPTPPGPTPTGTPPPGAGTLTRVEAIQRAEAWVRAQGYTDAEVSLAEADLRREMTDPAGGVAEVLVARRGTLEPRAVGAMGDGTSWTVAFRYQRPTRADAGRAVRITAGAEPSIVHQDLLLTAFLAPAAPPALVVIARLVSTGANAPGCGILHVAVEMEYEVIRIESGAHTGSTVIVIHGCPELPRQRYDAQSGSVTTFRVGDVHRLVLVTTVPPGVSAIPLPGSRPAPAFWAQRTDPAAS